MLESKGSSPPPIPGLELPKRKPVKPTVSNGAPLNALDIVGSLPPSIDTWSYADVTTFIVKLLSLPKALESDIKDFILTRKIDGAKLVKLDEGQLARLGFNKLWCHHLSAAVEDLAEIGGGSEASLDMCSSPDSKVRRKNHRSQASLAGIRPLGSFSCSAGTDLDKGHPNKPFSLPKLEMTLVRHYMISETAGLKEELGRIKKELYKNAATTVSSLATTSELLTPGGVDDEANQDQLIEETWFGFKPRTLAVAILATLGVISLFSYRSRPKK